MNQEMEYIIGKNPVIEALKSQRDINKILISEGITARTDAANNPAGQRRERDCTACSKKKLDQMTDGNHQGVLALCRGLSVCRA